eukprot:CAMPEP_0167744218 /NCGR_PEP_ID=MMETSP0110_2-20121227/2463_1 /TAXON_ID=629695 /ORGANISM="Gymnochlora sp., Strain CCMP2014" /LENGTH=316 /DNA_ID=CAMNT_0007628703 /DNA_START=249 /DNA_END=1196 /DNA_ORIENTATION=+
MVALYRKRHLSHRKFGIVTLSLLLLFIGIKRDHNVGGMFGLFSRRENEGPGYDKTPWVFKGRAIYQLHPVKVEEARKYIPSNVNIVQFGGYTLGGWYLANYTESPATDNKKFGELVALAGLVWNPPTSCAWASQVYVSSKCAKKHGERVVGLPENLATFELSHKDLKRPFLEVKSGGKVIWSGWIPRERTGWRAGFPIRMDLPSLSGCTRLQPNLLNYWLDLRGKLSLVAPTCKVNVDESSPLYPIVKNRPLVSMLFEDLSMDVNPPTKFDARQTFKNVPLPFLQASNKDSSWSLLQYFTKGETLEGNTVTKSSAT